MQTRTIEASCAPSPAWICRMQPGVGGDDRLGARRERRGRILRRSRRVGHLGLRSGCRCPPSRSTSRTRQIDDREPGNLGQQLARLAAESSGRARRDTDRDTSPSAAPARAGRAAARCARNSARSWTEAANRRRALGPRADRRRAGGRTPSCGRRSPTCSRRPRRRARPRTPRSSALRHRRRPARDRRRARSARRSIPGRRARPPRSRSSRARARSRGCAPPKTTDCTQPVSSATRARRGPSAGVSGGSGAARASPASAAAAPPTPAACRAGAARGPTAPDERLQPARLVEAQRRRRRGRAGADGRASSPKFSQRNSAAHRAPPGRCALDLGLGRLDQPPVGHAGGTHGLARAAVEAQRQMLDGRIAEADPPFGERLDEEDAAARRVHLGAELGERRAGRQTEPAVHALVDALHD